MGFAVTGLGVVSPLGDGVAAMVRALQGAGALSEPTEVTLDAAAASLLPTLARARQRWGPKRVAVVHGGTDEPATHVDRAAELAAAQGPAYAVTNGRGASAQAIVSAFNLLASDIADAVAVSTYAPRAAAWILLERQASAELELAHAAEFTDPRGAEWTAPDLSSHWGELGPATGLVQTVAVAVALDHGFVPAARGRPCVQSEAERAACIDTHTSITLAMRTP